MEKIRKNNSIINAITASIISIVILYLSPGVGLLYSFIQIVPFMLLFVVDGFKYWLAAIIATCLGGFFLVDIMTLGVQVGVIILASLVSGSLIVKERSLREIVRYTAFSIVIIYMLSIGGMYFIYGINPIEYLRNSMHASLDSTLDLMDFQIGVDTNELPNMVSDMKLYIDMLINLLPSMAFIYSYLISFINIYIGLSLAKIVEKKERYNLKLNSYHLGSDFKVFILVVIFSLIAINVVDLNYKEIISNNLIMLVSVFLFYDGLLLMDYIYSKRISLIFRIIIFALFIIFFRMYILFAIIGAFDVFVDIRKRRKDYEN